MSIYQRALSIKKVALIAFQPNLYCLVIVYMPKWWLTEGNVKHYISTNIILLKSNLQEAPITMVYGKMKKVRKMKTNYDIDSWYI